MLALMLVATACSSGSGAGEGREVVAAVAPLADLVVAVGGAEVSVRNITPAGAEAHSYEPTPDDVAALQRAELVVYLGARFQPAVARAVRSRPALARLDLLAGSPTVDPEVHLWLDPDNMRVWTREVRDRLSRLVPGKASVFAENAERYMTGLLDLDERYRSGLRSCRHRTMVVTHDAFGVLADRYELTQVALAGEEPEVEPDPSALAEALRVIRTKELEAVFTEPGAPDRVTRTVIRETGVRAVTLDPLELAAEKATDTYIARMNANLEALRDGLGCS